MSKPNRVKIDLPFRSDDELLEMVAHFEACQWPYPRWTHRAHLGVAVVYLRQHSFDAALERIRQHIQLYNRTCGDPEGYHETITILFMRRVNRFLQDNRELESLAGAVDEWAAILDMKWPLTYYSPELLWSAEAKARWAEPDLRQIDF